MTNVLQSNKNMVLNTYVWRAQQRNKRRNINLTQGVLRMLGGKWTYEQYSSYADRAWREAHESKDVALTLLKKYAAAAAKIAKEGVKLAKTQIRKRLDELAQSQYAAAAAAAAAAPADGHDVFEAGDVAEYAASEDETASAVPDSPSSSSPSSIRTSDSAAHDSAAVASYHFAAPSAPSAASSAAALAAVSTFQYGAGAALAASSSVLAPTPGTVFPPSFDPSAAAAPSAPAATNVDFYSSSSASASLVSPPALLVGSPAGGSPITINRVYSLRSRDLVKYATLESDTFVCVRDLPAAGPAVQVTIVEIAKPSESTTLPIQAASVIMHPAAKVIAYMTRTFCSLFPTLVLYNIETKSKMKAHNMPEPVVFWKWISPSIIALVTANAVFHWTFSGVKDKFSTLAAAKQVGGGLAFPV